MKRKKSKRMNDLIESLDDYSMTSAEDKTVMLHAGQYDELYSALKGAYTYSESFVFTGSGGDISIKKGRNMVCG